MRFQVRRQDTLSIPLTPLIDVVFLLLLFFMLTATFSEFEALDVQLPIAGAEQTEVGERLDLVIDAQGRYYLQGQGVTLENLREQIMSVLEQQPEAVVYLHADAYTAHQSVVQVMAEIRTLGVRRVRIATLAPR